MNFMISPPIETAFPAPTKITKSAHKDRENLVRVPLKKFQTAVHEELGFYASSGDVSALATGSHLHLHDYHDGYPWEERMVCLPTCEWLKFMVNVAIHIPSVMDPMGS